MVSRWRCKNTDNIPSCFDSMRQTRMGKSCFSLPLRERQLFSIIFKKYIITLVNSLFCCCGPTAIPRSIRAIVIDSIDREGIIISVFHGPFHKRLKFHPFRTNSTLAICSIVFCSLTENTAFHVFPYFIDTRSFHAMCSICFVASYSLLTRNTTTATRMSDSELIPSNNALFSTVTLAKPCGMSSIASNMFNDSEPSEFLPFNIDYSQFTLLLFGIIILFMGYINKERYVKR